MWGRQGGQEGGWNVTGRSSVINGVEECCQLMSHSRYSEPVILSKLDGAVFCGGMYLQYILGSSEPS